MPIDSRYFLLTRMDVEPGMEDVFNEVYDKEHVPELLKVPGVLSAVRFKRFPKVEIAIGGGCRCTSTSTSLPTRRCTSWRARTC